MTDCPDGELHGLRRDLLPDLLPDLLHDRLTPAAKQRVEAHLRACDDCRQELALLRAVRGTLLRTPAVDVAAIAAAIPAYRPAARRSWTGWRAAAAIALLAAGGTSVAVMQRSGSIARDTLLTMSAPVTVGVDSPVASMALGTTRNVGDPSVPAVQQLAPRELALGSTAVGELSDGELSALLADLESIEALPSADAEPLPVSPVAPKGTD